MFKIDNLEECLEQNFFISGFWNDLEIHWNVSRISVCCVNLKIIGITLLLVEKWFWDTSNTRGRDCSRFPFLTMKSGFTMLGRNKCHKNLEFQTLTIAICAKRESMRIHMISLSIVTNLINFFGEAYNIFCWHFLAYTQNIYWEKSWKGFFPHNISWLAILTYGAVTFNILLS